jgi:hypothetical protein
MVSWLLKVSAVAVDWSGLFVFRTSVSQVVSCQMLEHLAVHWG